MTAAIAISAGWEPALIFSLPGNISSYADQSEGGMVFMIVLEIPKK